MADVMRFRHADPKRVIRQPVDSATVIEVGDLLFLDTDDVKPANDQADQGTETANKTAFANTFAGVAMDASASGDTDDVAVATAGVFEFDVASGTFNAFDLVSVEADATTAGPTSSQHVESTTTNAEAIAFVAKPYASATTSVEVELLPIMVTRLSAL